MENIVEIFQAATPRYKSIILFKWQSFMHNARMIYANEHCSDQIVQQLQAGADPIQVNLPGRKENENDSEGKFYTYIGKDAADALTKCFDEERGWPKKGEPLWVQSNGVPLTKPSFETTWRRLFRRVGKYLSI